MNFFFYKIADLKTELAKAEENLKIRTDELLQSKKDLRVKDEEIQQREIEISCLRGQVSNNGSVSVCIVVIIKISLPRYGLNSNLAI